MTLITGKLKFELLATCRLYLIPAASVTSDQSNVGFKDAVCEKFIGETRVGVAGGVISTIKSLLFTTKNSCQSLTAP